MPDLKIYPLIVGMLEGDHSSLTYLRNAGHRISFPVTMWYIEGAEKKILVDTGPPEPGWATEYHWPLTQTKDQQPENALDKVGASPEDVDIVILSHLHWDHAFNNHLFTRAEFFVQAEELRHAANPIPVQARGYEAVSVGMKPNYIFNTAYTVIEGDREIVPGVEVILTPGHTPGSMSVVVDTARGKHIIATDTVPLFENWRGDPPLLKHIPSSIHVGLVEYFETFDKLDAVGGVVLPGHDPALADVTVYPELE